MAFYDSAHVKDTASGKWLEILAMLSKADIHSSIRKPGKHYACPKHKSSRKAGKGDGFRLFRDVVQTGGGICNTCGPRSDGFELLMWLNDWSFRETLEEVAKYLRIEPEVQQESKKVANGQAQIVCQPKRRAVAGAQSGSQATTSSAPPQEKPRAPVVSLHKADTEVLREIRKIQEKLNNEEKRERVHCEAKISQVWRESMSLNHSGAKPVNEYFARRKIAIRNGINRLDDTLRAHSSLPYYEEDEEGDFKLVGNYPALIAAIRDLKGSIVSLHRIYLTRTGRKAKLSCPKKMMSVPHDKTVTGCSVQLGGQPRGGVLGVAEGIETAMAAMRSSEIPCWSAISATIMEGFEPPEGVHTVLIWADKDRSKAGEQSAQVLKEKLEEKGIKALILLPRQPIQGKSVDWCDVMESQGVLGFPRRKQLHASVGLNEVQPGCSIDGVIKEVH